MGDDGRVVADDAVPMRIGRQERDDALQALDVHLEAGRLEADEYGERAAKVSLARTSADLAPLFADLPAPHPPTVPGRADPSSLPPYTPLKPPERDARRPLGGRAGEIAVAASPFVAVALFFLLNGVFASAWIVFLLVPVSGAIVYGRNWRGQ
jgi:hypothetical protein